MGGTSYHQYSEFEIELIRRVEIVYAIKPRSITFNKKETKIIIIIIIIEEI